jgi:hypothetical protein
MKKKNHDNENTRFRTIINKQIFFLCFDSFSGKSMVR